MDNLYTFACYTAFPDELAYFIEDVPDDVPDMEIGNWFEAKTKERVHSFWKKRTAEETRQWLDNWRKARGFTDG
jgi:hypothetical protein